ncbi:MAG: hypothetical protein HOZ81_46825 [Streptomyces sp.]|nr:hypothetical protein [Streptomyces sp.]NUS24438.1 hypothetical protein [Streptomyces sp.]
MTNTTDEHDRPDALRAVPQYVTRAQLFAAVEALGLSPRDLIHLCMHRDGVTVVFHARDAEGQVIVMGDRAAQVTLDIPVREAPPECPPACADGHMYDGHCTVDPYAGLPEGARIASNDFPRDKWAWRCEGADGCEGWLSLDHSSPAAARRAYDRHAKAEHGTTEAQQ